MICQLRKTSYDCDRNKEERGYDKKETTAVAVHHRRDRGWGVVALDSHRFTWWASAFGIVFQRFRRMRGECETIWLAGLEAADDPEERQRRGAVR